MKQYPWAAMRRAFEDEGLSCGEIARRFGAGYSTVTAHARREKWQAVGETSRQSGDLPQLVQRLTDTALTALEGIRQTEQPDIRSVKELTAMLRDLANLDKALADREGGESTVQVVLAPELEAWSR